MKGFYRESEKDLTKINEPFMLSYMFSNTNTNTLVMFIVLKMSGNKVREGLT